MNARDWQTSANRAGWLLRHADQAAPREPLRGMGLQLRLWRYPGAGVHVSWSILLPVREYRGKSGIVREASWDPTRERKRRAGFEPDVRIRDAEIAWEALSPFLETAGGFYRGRTGSDAASAPETNQAGVEGSRSFAHVCWEWSGRGPREWGVMIRWFEQFRKVLSQAFREKDAG